jgi:hypothetical protein
VRKHGLGLFIGLSCFLYTGVIIPDLKHFGTVPSLNIFLKIDFNKYTRDGPPNLK